MDLFNFSDLESIDRIDMQEPLRGKVAQKLLEEEIDDKETLKSITIEMWQILGFKMGEISKIKNAVEKFEKV